MPLPEKLPIRWMHDLHTSHVGRFNGSQLFLLSHHIITSAVAGIPKGEFVALYRFDKAGTLIGHEIVKTTEGSLDETRNRLLGSLEHYEFGDICVRPFQVTFEDQLFGLVADAKQHTITLEPGGMITFMEPWDGEYYT